jgi:hypothetical protein
VATPPPTVATKPKNDTSVPASLVVSAMGSNPACEAACDWGDLADNGFPKTAADGTRAITCKDGAAWRASSWTKIESGSQARCYTVSGIKRPE